MQSYVQIIDTNNFGKICANSSPPPQKKILSSCAYVMQKCLLIYLQTCLEKDHLSSISRVQT